jgi:hypothetical protein
MRLPRWRFSVRRLLAVVAVLGLILGGIDTIRRRGSHFQILSAYHWNKCPSRFGGYDSPHYQWHSSLAKKYRLAASRPWLPVAADPPAPADTGDFRCLCGYQFSADDRIWRQDNDLLIEYFEREGWTVSCDEGMVVGGTFFATAEKGKTTIEVQATTEQDAWRLLFDQLMPSR